MTEHDLLTPDQAAEMLTISKKTLQEFVHAGEIAFIPIGRGQKRLRKGFDRQDILDFIDRRRKRQCPSSNTPKAPTTKSSSGSTVLLFEALPKPATKKKQKQ